LPTLFATLYLDDTMDTVFVVVDTNTFLHYVSLDQVDWNELFPAQNVVLVISSPVIRELNNHKDTPRNSKVRERATAAFRKIDAWADSAPPVTLRDGVEVRFRFNDSGIEFAAHNLVRHIADDHLIATLIELKVEASPTPVVLLTRDTGLKHKAKAHGFSVKSLPDSAMLPDEVLPDEKKIKELEALVRELQNTRPKLRLAFAGGGNTLNLSFQRTELLSESDIADRMAHLRNEYPKMVERSKAPSSDSAPYTLNNLFSAALDAAAVDSDSIRKYNDRLEVFLKEYEKYLTRLAVFYAWECRTAAISIILVNDGSCPADDIDIIMHFADGFELFDEGEYQEEPEAPKAPQKPRSIWEGAANATGLLLRDFDLRDSDLYSASRHRSPASSSNVSCPTIKRTNSYDVKVNVNKAKHGIEAPLDPLYLTFEPSAALRGFRIDYEIHASNLARPVTGKLNVIV
jgi:rRNA-processing protein FCF1